MFWFDRSDPRAVFVDRRVESHVLPDISSAGGSRTLPGLTLEQRKKNAAGDLTVEEMDAAGANLRTFTVRAVDEWEFKRSVIMPAVNDA